MLKLILIRHAESEMNKLGIHQGQLHNSNLSKRGIEQVKEISCWLKSQNITEIFASDMNRTLETAKIISKELGGIEIKEDKRLREFTMGDFDKSPETRDRAFKKFYEEEFAKGKSKYEIRPPNGENIWDFIKRINSFLEEIKNKKETILVVAHGGVNEVILNLIQKLDKDNFRRYHQDNVCVNELVYENDNWNIISINKISHLKSLIKPGKIAYSDQNRIKEGISLYVSNLLIENEISNAYLFGSLINKNFGKYTEIYGRHKGSNINVLAFVERRDIPKKWKYVGKEEGFWEVYEIGKYEIDGIKHKIDLFIVSLDNKQKVDAKIKELDWKPEKII